MKFRKRKLYTRTYRYRRRRYTYPRACPNCGRDVWWNDDSALPVLSIGLDGFPARGEPFCMGHKFKHGISITRLLEGVSIQQQYQEADECGSAF